MDKNPLFIVGKLLNDVKKSRKRKLKMPEKEWMDLYLCKCMNDLKSRSEIKDIQKKFGNVHTPKLMESMKVLLKQAEESEKKKDMENTYIFLSRFFELFVFMNETRKEESQFFKIMFGKDIQKGIKRLDQLSKLLESRYQKKAEDQGDIRSRILPKLLKSPVDKENENDIEEKRPKKGDKEPLTITKPTNTDSITSLELRNYLKDGKSIAIFDVRRPESFHKSKINSDGVKIINIFDEIVPSKIGKMFENDAEAAKIWEDRKSFEIVAIVDEVKVDSQSFSTSAAGKLFKSLQEYDYLRKYKCLKYLEDGFREWHHKYPTLCSRTKYPEFEKIYDSSGDVYGLSLLDQIKYPTLEEPPASVHKPSNKTTTDGQIPPSSVTTKQIPTVNRQIKPTIIGKSVTKPTEISKQNGHSLQEDVATDQITADKDNTPLEIQSDLITSSDKSKPLIVDRSTKPTGLKSVHNFGDVGNVTQKPDQSSSSNDEWIGSSGTTLEALKSDSSSSSSGMKRSSSFPNLSKLTADDDEVSTPPPTRIAAKFDRSTKPIKSTSSASKLKPQDAGIFVSNITPGLTGLKNLGNTCYMNSIVQCLSNTDALRQQICTFSKDGLRGVSGTPSASPSSVALHLDKVVRKLWAGNHKCFPCDELKTVCGKLKSSFRGYEQQDSHEFLTVLLDWLHEDLNVPAPLTELSGASEASGELAWGQFRRKNNSIVINLFYGQLKSTVTCLTCAKESTTFEPFSNLSLPLPPQNLERCTLQDCLELYLKEEGIAGWNCPQCKAPRSATKKIDISRLPPILVIHLKRFTSNGARKKQTLVDFPVTDRLEMLNYATNTREQRNSSYDLYAVSNHYGAMESGHYTAYCLNPVLKRWYEFNDTEVLEMQVHNVRTAAAYILFYKAQQQ